MSKSKVPNGSVVAAILLKLHDDGSMSIEGNVGDVRLAIGMLDSAKEAVTNQIGKPCILEPNGRGIELPRQDVVAPQSPIYPTVPYGDTVKR